MRKGLLLAAVGLAAALCTLAACSGGNETDAASVEPTVTQHPPPTTRQDTGSAEDGGGGGFLDALAAAFEEDTDACVDAISARLDESSGKTLPAVARDVARLRGLRFERIPRPRYLPSSRLTRRLLRDFERSYPSAEVERDERAWIALGALPEGADLKALVRRLLAAEVAGFYDPRTGELFVESDDDPELGSLERVILAHELEHALADQALELPGYLQVDHVPPGTEDAALAGLAVVEGDATLTEEAYTLSALSFLDTLRAVGPALGALDSAGDLPHHLEASLIFPYLEGASFVCTLYERGGWRAVDRAYARPPTTSAQIMFPERYFAREGAVKPRAPGAPGRTWRRLPGTAIGAADLLWLFEAPAGDADKDLSDAEDRAAAWAGGALQVWTRGTQTAVALTLVERPGERDLCESMRAWFGVLAEERHRVGVVRCPGRQVRVGIAPTSPIARRIAGNAEPTRSR